MRVLVTRPEPSAAATAEKLIRLGHQPVLFPLTRAKHDSAALRGALLGRTDAGNTSLVVTSAQALRALSGLPELAAPHLTRPIYAVGKATAQAARDLGFRDVRTGTGTGAGLADLILRDLAGSDIGGVGQAHLLYLAGHPRSPDLENALENRGLPIGIVEAYRMEPITHPAGTLAAALRHPATDTVLLYSREAARLFADHLRHEAIAPSDLTFLCLSQAVADAIPLELRSNIKIASHPEEEALLALL